MGEDVADGHALAGPLADHMDGVGEFGVVDGGVVGRLAGRDSQGREKKNFILDRLAFDQFRQEFCCAVADSFRVGDDAREGGLAQLAEDVVVVDAEDRDFFRGVDPGVSAGVDDLVAAVVVTGKDADGLGESRKPRGEGLAVFSPRVAGDFVPADVHGGIGQLRFFDEFGEGFFPSDGPDFLLETAEGEVLIATVEVVFGGHLSDGGVVGADHGEAEGLSAVGQLDEGGAVGFDAGGQFWSRLAGHHAVATPVEDPFGDLGFDIALFEEDRPFFMKAHVADDAPEEISPVGGGGFDDEGDVFIGGHGRSWS